MNEQQQNSNQLPDWNRLPLPDENAAWHDMQRRLDDEQRRRPLVPPRIVYGCAAVILLAALATGSYFFLRQDQQEHDRPASFNGQKKEPSGPIPGGRLEDAPGGSPATAPGTAQDPSTTHGTIENNKKKPGNNKEVPATEQSNRTYKEQGTGIPRAINQPARRAEPANIAGGPVARELIAGRSPSANPAQARRDNAIRITAAKPSPIGETPVVHHTNKDSFVVSRASAGHDDAPTETRSEGTSNQRPVDSVQVVPQQVKERSVPLLTTGEAPAPADAIVTQATPINDSAINTTSRTKRAGNKWEFAAGLGLQQQLRTGSQAAYAAGYDGRKNFLQNAIPSVFLRAKYGRHWFVQLEGRYNAPRLVPEFSYSRQTVVDLSAEKQTVTYQRLRKTYYHQFPVTLNYHIVKNWSVGAGASYARLYRAVAEKEVVEQGNGGAQTLSRTAIQIPGFRDSFLYKSQVQWVMQTDYQWRKLSLGLRYLRDAQPYIRYTLPDGSIRSRTNHALEAVLRFRLWESRKK